MVAGRRRWENVCVLWLAMMSRKITCFVCFFKKSSYDIFSLKEMNSHYFICLSLLGLIYLSSLSLRNEKGQVSTRKGKYFLY